MAKRDPYKLLNVDKDASPAVIRKAYRKRAAEVHPDNQESGNQEVYIELGWAHRLLMDPKAREAFDAGGVVSGEDKVTDLALEMLAKIGVEVATSEPEGNVVANMRGYLVKLSRQTSDTLIVADKAKLRIEERWTGTDAARHAVLERLSEKCFMLRSQKKVEERAKELLTDSKYTIPPPPEKTVYFGSRMSNWPGWVTGSY